MCDDNYVYPLIISIGAIGLQNLSRTEISLVNIPNWTPENALIQESSIKLIKSVCATFGMSFRLIELNLENQDMIGARTSYGHIPGTAWAKVLALFQMDFGKDSEILYLDPDTLVLNGYEEIFSFESFSPLGIMARPTPGHTLFEKKWGEKFFQQTGVYPQDKLDWYFNSGVMRLDLWKFQNFSHWIDWRKLLKKNVANHLVLQDQDFLNAISVGQIDKLNQSFNCYPSDFLVEETRILHFAGGYKPWHFRNPLSRFRINRNAKAAMKIWRKKESEIREKLALDWDSGNLDELLRHKKSIDKGFAFALAKVFPTIANTKLTSFLIRRVLRRPWID